MKDIKFQLRMNEKKKDRRKELAKKQGYAGLGTLIEDLLRLYEHNPEIVNPTKFNNDTDLSDIIDKLEGTKTADFDQINARLSKIEASLEVIMKSLDIEEKDEDMEAVFGGN